MLIVLIRFYHHQYYKYISLFGDFNSRTAEDFIDFEINEHEHDFTEFLQNDLVTLNELNIEHQNTNDKNLVL
jgi:hypothetical protein